MIRLAVAILLVGVSALLMAGCMMSVESRMEVAGPDEIAEVTTIRYQINSELLAAMAEQDNQSTEEDESESPNDLDSFGPQIAEAMQPEVATLREQGYTVAEEIDGQSYQLTVSKTQTRAEWLAPSALSPQGQRTFEVTEQDGQRRYRLALMSTGSATTTLTGPLFPPTDSTDPAQQELKSFMDLRLAWQVTLPGQIVATNAPTVEGQTAIWTLDIFGAESLTEWYAESVETIAP